MGLIDPSPLSEATLGHNVLDQIGLELWFEWQQIVSYMLFTLGRLRADLL